MTDNDLTVTRIDTVAGQPLAVLVNFTRIPTFMSGEDMLFSGDWPGYLQRTVESLVGGGVTAMYYNGAEGDQAPVSRPDAGYSRWERAERYGTGCGHSGWKQWQSTKTAADAPLAYHAHLIALPERSWHPTSSRPACRIWPQRRAVEENAAGVVPAESRQHLAAAGRFADRGNPGERPPRWG